MPTITIRCGGKKDREEMMRALERAKAEAKKIVEAEAAAAAARATHPTETALPGDEETPSSPDGAMVVTASRDA